MKAGQLTKWRKGNALTQQQAADALGVSVRSLISYEQGGKIPRYVDIALAAHIAGLDVESVLIEHDSKPHEPAPAAHHIDDKAV